MEYKRDPVAIQAVMLKRKQHRVKQLHDAEQTPSAAKRKKHAHTQSRMDEDNQQELLSSLAVDLTKLIGDQVINGEVEEEQEEQERSAGRDIGEE